MIRCIDCVTTAEVEALDGDPRWAVVSIEHPGMRATALRAGFGGVLRLAGVDGTAGHRSAPARSDAQYRRMGREALAFLIDIQRLPRLSGLICACRDGVSASSAIAAFASDLYGAQWTCRRPTDARASPIFAALRHASGELRVRQRSGRPSALALT